MGYITFHQKNFIHWWSNYIILVVWVHYYMVWVIINCLFLLLIETNFLLHNAKNSFICYLLKTRSFFIFILFNGEVWLFFPNQPFYLINSNVVFKSSNVQARLSVIELFTEYILQIDSQIILIILMVWLHFSILWVIMLCLFLLFIRTSLDSMFFSIDFLLSPCHLLSYLIF